jgi:hypothetical protein
VTGTGPRGPLLAVSAALVVLAALGVVLHWPAVLPVVLLAAGAVALAAAGLLSRPPDPGPGLTEEQAAEIRALRADDDEREAIRRLRELRPDLSPADAVHALRRL